MNLVYSSGRRARRLGPSLVSLALALALLTGLLPAAVAAPSAPAIAGSGAIVVDFQTDEVYYEKKADVTRPAASMTKLMSLYLVFEEIEAGNLSLDSYVTASSYAAGISNNNLYSGLERLKTGGQYQVETLMKLIMTASCNGSVIVLAERVGGTEAEFVARMNAKAEEWGIDAHFADCTGFKDAGNAVSPRAMAYIAKRLITDYPKILEYSSLKSTTFQGKTFNSTNTLLRNGTCEGIDGLKSGTTNGAGYCYTGTAIRDGRRVISVVMNSTSYAARMSDTKKLLDYGFACRKDREAAWAAAAEALTVTVTSDSEYLWPYTQSTLTAAFGGTETATPCTLAWELNGEPVGEPQSDFMVGAGVQTAQEITPPAGVESLTAAVVLTLPDGTQVRRETELNVPPEELSVSGHLGVRKIEMYPGAAIPVSMKAQCDQGVSITVPAGWYMDGAPIPKYQNGAFKLAPNAASNYTLKTEDLAPGRHVLEFRCNPEGLPGVKQASFPLEITILAE